MDFVSDFLKTFGKKMFALIFEKIVCIAKGHFLCYKQNLSI